jgi:oligopeptide/dipeptide ABC transporter ATP-binding protein
MTTLLEVHELAKHYGSPRGRMGVVHAVDGISFEIAEGEALGLVGESGSGKSTTARTVMRLYQPTAGTIRFEGNDITRLRRQELRPVWRDMQMVYQDPYSSLDPRMTVHDLVAEPLRVHRRTTPYQDHRARVRDLLERVGLDVRLAQRFPHELSGGQRQRVGIARALALDPKLLILDEPVSALDVSVQAQVLNLLRDLQRDLGLAFLFVSHDLAVVRHVCRRVAVMYLGRIVEIGDAETIYASPAHPYTQALLSAVPITNPADRGTRNRTMLKGGVPRHSDPRVGCGFRSRCPMATDLCADTDPPPRDLGHGHLAACHHLEDTT